MFGSPLLHHSLTALGRVKQYKVLRLRMMEVLLAVTPGSGTGHWTPSHLARAPPGPCQLYPVPSVVVCIFPLWEEMVGFGL